MKESIWFSYFLKFIWTVGLIVFAILSIDYEYQLKQTATETFKFIPLIWSKLIISIVFGLYFSLLFVKKWSIRINPSLLWCVAIPCIILSFAFPILVSLSSAGQLPADIASSPIPSWLQSIYSTNLFGILAGLTLILSFFNAQPTSK